MSPGGRRVLVTHADEPIGRRLVKTLYHDGDVERIWAVGAGRPPRSFDRFLRAPGDRLRYTRLDLAKHRPVADLFHSAELRAAGLDAVVHLPEHGAPSADGVRRPLPAGVSGRTAEARMVLQQCQESPPIRQLVVVGSAFVYRLQPGNANRMTEHCALDLDPDVAPELRSWIDCDMIFHGELRNDRLRVCLLRAPTVVATGGYVFLNPAFPGPGRAPLRPLGFDPLCPLISDKDLAQAARLALHRRRSGIFNVAGRESLPLSQLARWVGGRSRSLPGPWLRQARRVAEWVGREDLRSRLDGPHLRHGFTLDTARAERELGFRPAYRIGLSHAGDGRLRIETAPA